MQAPRKRNPRIARALVSSALTGLVVIALTALATAALAQDDARTKQLRLLCAQLSGDLTEPGGIQAFRRCLSSKDPLNEIRKDNNIGQGVRTTGHPVQLVYTDRPDAAPPSHFGRNSRSSLADGVDLFHTADGKTWFAIDKDAKLWRWTAGAKDARTIEQGVASFTVDASGALLVKDTKGELWREGNDPKARSLVDRGVATWQPVSASLLYVQGSDGTLWRESGASPHIIVDRTVAAFQAIDASVVFVLGTDRKLWRETGDLHTRTLVASNIASFQYVPDGDTTYVQTTDGGLWRQEGNAKPESVDTSVAAFHAVDMHLAYVLGKDGRLWRELGNRSQAVLVDHGLLVAADLPSFQAIDSQHVAVLGNDHKLWAETMPAGR
jgi:hypothetical protein